MATQRNEPQPEVKATPVAGASNEAPRIRWDDSNMKSSYANVCNVSFTREEVVLMFGINQAWNRDQKEVPVQLTDRIILSPFAARRLAALLGNIVREYDSRFPSLDAPTLRPVPKTDQ